MEKCHFLKFKHVEEMLTAQFDNFKRNLKISKIKSKIELIICIIIETFSLFAVFKTKYTFPKNVELFYLIKGTVLSINRVVYPTPTLL